MHHGERARTRARVRARCILYAFYTHVHDVRAKTQWGKPNANFHSLASKRRPSQRRVYENAYNMHDGERARVRARERERCILYAFYTHVHDVKAKTQWGKPNVNVHSLAPRSAHMKVEYMQTHTKCIAHAKRARARVTRAGGQVTRNSMVNTQL